MFHSTLKYKTTKKKSLLWNVYIGNVILSKMSATATEFLPWPPWATLVAIADIIMINFISVNTALWTNILANCTRLSVAKKKKVICTKFAPGVFVEIVEMKVVAESMIRLLMSSIYTIVKIGVRKKVSLVKVHLHNAENRAKLVGKKQNFFNNLSK